MRSPLMLCGPMNVRPRQSDGSGSGNHSLAITERLEELVAVAVSVGVAGP